MKILALEFSSDQRSVALCELVKGVAQIMGQACEKGGRSTRAIGLIEKVLAEAGIRREEVGCLAIGIGPGSYTGIRAGIALAQGWQLASAVKTMGISSVECLAAQAQQAGIFGEVNIIIDAQRDEFYLAKYDLAEGRREETEKLCLVSKDEVKRRLAAAEVVVGPDAGVLGGRELFPDAGVLAALATTRLDFVPADRLEPIYLRETNFVKAPPARVI